MAELSKRLLRLGIVLLTLSLVGCDHATKIAAHAGLAGRPAIPIYDGIVELRYAPNPDTAFSLLRNFGVAQPVRPVFLVMLASAALLGVVYAWIMAARRGAARGEHVAFAFILAGAIGNVLDRALHGYVVDFIRIGWWPVFNVADVLVGVGVALLLLTRWRRQTRAPA
jgi:signal peptidase II